MGKGEDGKGRRARKGGGSWGTSEVVGRGGKKEGRGGGEGERGDDGGWRWEDNFLCSIAKLNSQALRSLIKPSWAL